MMTIACGFITKLFHLSNYQDSWYITKKCSKNALKFFSKLHQNWLCGNQGSVVENEKENRKL